MTEVAEQIVGCADTWTGLSALKPAEIIRRVEGFNAELWRAMAGRAPIPDIRASLVEEKDFARGLGVNLRTVRRMRKSGTSPTVTRIGAKVFYAKDSIDGWLLDRRVKPAKKRTI